MKLDVRSLRFYSFDVPKHHAKRMTTIAVDVEVLDLIEAIADRRSKQLDFRVSKGAVVRNLVVHEARTLGLYHPKKSKK